MDESAARRTAGLGFAGGVVHLTLVVAVYAWLAPNPTALAYFTTSDLTVAFWA